MKYVIVIPDGAADEPQDQLENKTPLQAANTPAMDSVASRGIVGRANHTPRKFDAGSAVANMSLLGYDPLEFYSGRAPIEAAASDLKLGPHDWAIRCNLVNIQNQVMSDFTAGHISTDEASQLLSVAAENTDDCFEFVTGVSYRNLLIYRGNEKTPAPFSRETRTSQPHDLTDLTIVDEFPRGPGSDILTNLMHESSAWFSDHPVNQKRIANNQLPATNAWLWGLGQTPKLAPFSELHSLNGAMITAVDLLRGLAKLIGWQCIDVPSATGYVDTDYAAKGKHAIEALNNFDVVCVHIEATDEASHEGELQKKVTAIESIDQEIVQPILDSLDSSGEPWKLLVTPDHPTHLKTKKHTHGDVPFAMCGTGIDADSATAYNEATAAESETAFDQGYDLMPFFITGN